PRFSIAALLTAIVVCGLGLTALRQPSQLWASSIFTVTTAVLIAAAVNAAYLRRPPRAFWAGFAIWGWAYWAANFGPWAYTQVGPPPVTPPPPDTLPPQGAPPPPAPAAAPRPADGGGMIVQLDGQAGPPRGRWAVWTETDRTTRVGYRIGQVALVSPGPFRRI